MSKWKKGENKPKSTQQQREIKKHQEMSNNSKKKSAKARWHACAVTLRRSVLGSWGRTPMEKREEKRENWGVARRARGRAAVSGRPCPVPAPAALARAGRLALPRVAPALPDLHVSELHSHARQCLPAGCPTPAPAGPAGVRSSRAAAAPSQRAGGRAGGRASERRASHLPQPAPRCRRD